MNTRIDDGATLVAKIDHLTGLVESLAERAARQQELIDEMSPIVKEVMRVGVDRFAELEQRGYFAFGRESLAVLDRVVSSYGPEDVSQLGDNIVRILDTVKRVTQPDVLAVAQDATMALSAVDEVEPKGVLGMLRETRDDDIRRGVAILLEVLRYVGRGTARIAAESGAPVPVRQSDAAQLKLARLLGPTRAPSARAPQAPAAKPGPAAAAPAAAGATECTLVPEGVWNREWAARAAASIGVPELSDDHWKVIEYARREFFESGASPNVRKVADGSGVDTRTLYGLWPNKPGIATAFVAGIPKPGGCL